MGLPPGGYWIWFYGDCACPTVLLGLHLCLWIFFFFLVGSSKLANYSAVSCEFWRKRWALVLLLPHLEPIFYSTVSSEFASGSLWLCLADSLAYLSYRGCQSNGPACFRHQISLSRSRRKTHRLFWMCWNFITQRRPPTARSTWALQVWRLCPGQSKGKKCFHVGCPLMWRKNNMGRVEMALSLRWNFEIWELRCWVFASNLSLYSKTACF